MIKRNYSKDRKCPWCGLSYKKLYLHMKQCCNKQQGLSDDQIKLESLKAIVGENFLDQLIEDYNNLYSLTDLRKKYNIDLKSICWCLNYCNVKIRNISESQRQITQKKIKSTLQKQYGVEYHNVSQLSSVKKKKAETFINHYGVDNIWKTKEYAEFTSKRWSSYTPEKKHELIKKWTRREGRISKLENLVSGILNTLQIPIETQFKFPKYFHKYDIHIKNTNIILEIQGDFWHANPKNYKEDDILNFPNGLSYTAKQLWNKDKQNFLYAQSQNYIVIEIWESDINIHKKQNDLEIYLLDILNKVLTIK